MKTWILNAGGTLGMIGNPLRPARSAAELLEGINVPAGLDLNLVDFPERQDSTNVTHAQRIEMSKLVEEAYDEHDAFVIMHGTDSLALTTAMLSVIFKLTLQKPLFVIGAQMSKDESGSDVPMQIANTLRVAEVFARREIVGVYNVCIGDIWHGGRLMKRAESDPNAFWTPGMHTVGQCWPHVLLREGLRKRNANLDIQGLRRDVKFEQGVAAYKVSADVPPWVLMDLVRHDRIKGAILECRGAGQIPDVKVDDPAGGSYSWIDVIAEATRRGIHIGVLSPFVDGRVNLRRYELGQKVRDAGGLSLESLVPDMADVKFRQAIAMFPTNPARIQQFLSTDLVGGELLPGLEDDAESAASK